MTDVLMTGTMHWDSRRMVSVLEQSLLELTYPTITNEDPAAEFDVKIRLIEQLWRGASTAWPWGTTEELDEFSRLRKVSHVPISRTSSSVTDHATDCAYRSGRQRGTT